MANWPHKTEADLIAAGYKFDSRGTCKGPNCGAEIEWWTTPRLKQMPLDPGTLEPHFETCPDSSDFRKDRT